MTYRILSTNRFSKEFRKLPSDTQERIREKLKEVAVEPSRYKKLHYDLSGSSRVRIGKLRVIFSYDPKKQEVYLEKIGPSLRCVLSNT